MLILILFTLFLLNPCLGDEIVTMKADELPANNDIGVNNKPEDQGIDDDDEDDGFSIEHFLEDLESLVHTPRPIQQQHNILELTTQPPDDVVNIDPASQLDNTEILKTIERADKKSANKVNESSLKFEFSFMNEDGVRDSIFHNGSVHDQQVAENENNARINVVVEQGGKSEESENKENSDKKVAVVAEKRGCASTWRRYQGVGTSGKDVQLERVFTESCCRIACERTEGCSAVSWRYKGNKIGELFASGSTDGSKKPGIAVGNCVLHVGGKASRTKKRSWRFSTVQRCEEPAAECPNLAKIIDNVHMNCDQHYEAYVRKYYDAAGASWSDCHLMTEYLTCIEHELYGVCSESEMRRSLVKYSLDEQDEIEQILSFVEEIKVFYLSEESGCKEKTEVCASNI